MTDDKMRWFREARFGMFIHWGLYSLLGCGEWVMHNMGIPLEEYGKLAEGFRPKPDCARAWAALARRAGMKYVVFTTKHHDGFCLWDSQLTDYTSVRHGAGRDYVREVAEAFRAEGLRVGLYYSLGDWHFPPYLAVARGDSSRIEQLRDYLHGQVRELLTGYGPIDMLWYDGAWFDGSYLTAETLDAARMEALARSLQPHILINDRSGVPGDFSTCENECKPAPPGRDWEMCTCINDLWGYAEHDYNYKTVNQLIFTLVNCAVQGGNFLLNIGPRGDGSVPGAQAERLEAVGKWLEVNGQSVYGVERLSRPMYGSGRITKKDGRLYLHTFYWAGGEMRVPFLGEEELGGAPGTVQLKARVPATGQETTTRWDADVLVVEGLPETPPDKADTVVVLENI